MEKKRQGGAVGIYRGGPRLDACASGIPGVTVGEQAA
jgi:hypothetical protein